MWPGYALRSTGFFLAIAAILVLLGGLVQINPIWLWGQYHTYVGTNGAQPDWYLGWLIGGLRMVPSFDVIVGGHDLIPNPFWGGALFPMLIFGLLYAWPWLDRRFISRESAKHELLDRPRDNPTRTALAVAVLAWVVTVFTAGSADRVYYQFGIPYTGVIWFYRGAFFVMPVVVFFLTRAICRQLKRSETYPLRGWSGRITTRNAAGGYEAVGVERAVELDEAAVHSGRFEVVSAPDRSEE
jgi:ubiquinol-cytochrome c reductase cytochrome b subunit